ncbi:hypothetical protein CGMCC3_g2828 [Colletotrichum fructicola]|nr:uncharacterized protein CGMCC3_g2828 [Colletotrichum fructicola]KAE9581256.1 hypothetical protein CGMCC3_g2828 [Colletotrichum fructicola]
MEKNMGGKQGREGGERMPHDQSQKQADPNAAGSLFWGSLGQACKADNPGVSTNPRLIALPTSLLEVPHLYEPRTFDGP